MEGLNLRTDVTLVSERIDLATYLERTRRSAVVFNAPAVHQCLGWKLGEFLALGKAIISVPLNRELPEPLVHGEHIHFIDDKVDAMRHAVELLTSDDAYRRRLEVGARRWFDDVISPARVGQRLLSEVEG
ncbi:MAG: glycosyltransferase family 1 protein [Acidimicrobiia bacterium]|nr:glycosyltransferase family 1 protein [Acidimicrobiia bacterium]